MSSPIRAVIRLLLYLTLTFALMPAQLLALLAASRLRENIPLFYHRLCCRILGLTIEARGSMATNEPGMSEASTMMSR